ncbi:MAG: hypothetical protein ABIA21_00470 [Candidatus Aenigmatarchaeota archaeon]
MKRKRFDDYRVGFHEISMDSIQKLTHTSRIGIIIKIPKLRNTGMQQTSD